MKKQMGKFLVVASILSMTATALAQDVQKISDRVQKASEILNKIESTAGSSIPTSLLSKATCVAVIPEVVKVAVIFGGRGGKGMVSCRAGTKWSAPSFLTLAGGSWGLQLGVSSNDVVMVFIRSNAVEHLSGNTFNIGGDTSVTAGPVGRSLAAGTDFRLDSDVYTYSISKGVFAGIALDGTDLKPDSDANATAYNSQISATQLLSVQMANLPSVVRPFTDALDTYAP